MPLESLEITKALLLSAIAFAVAVAATPLLSGLLYRYKMGKSIRAAGDTPIFSKLQAGKAGTPTMGGILVWGTTLILVVVFAQIAQAFPQTFIAKLDFLSRAQTLLPLGALLLAAIVGFIDDYIDVKRFDGKAGGLRMRHRLAIYTAIAAAVAWWFEAKLDWDLIHVPFVGDFNIGLWFAPLAVFVIVATAFSVNESDGLDGLAGGTLMIAFGAYTLIAFSQGKYDLAAFCSVILGALLAFLWFNIHPARFFMGDTGAMALGVTLGVVALLTKSIFILPLIGFVFVVESASVIAQVLSRKLFHRRIFLSSPLHHHLEAKGWGEPKIVMRFWVIALVFAAIGLAVFLLDALS